jgi:hypothetical protein
VKRENIIKTQEAVRERKEERGDLENDLHICHDEIINRMHVLLDIVS